MLNALAGDLGDGDDLFSDPEIVGEAFARMSSERNARLNPTTAMESCRRYPLEAIPEEFAPDEAWFKRELAIVTQRIGIPIRESLSSEIANHAAGSSMS